MDDSGKGLLDAADRFDLMEKGLDELFQRRFREASTTQTRTAVLSMLGAVTVMAGLVLGVG